MKLFCEARRRMEQQHYLVFYKLRKWMENNLIAIVRSVSSKESAIVALKLDFYCVEALRRACLCGAAKECCLTTARLGFAFVPLPRTSVVLSSHSIPHQVVFEPR